MRAVVPRARDPQVLALEKQVTLAIEKEVTGEIKKLENKARCSFQGLYDEKKKACKCDDAKTGTRCEDQMAKNCAEAKKSGVQDISPDGKSKVTVYCETNIDGGRWDLIFNLKTNVAPALRWAHPFWQVDQSTCPTDGHGFSIPLVLQV